MAKPLTITEFARLGGKARAKNMTAQERSESARKAVKARWARIEKNLAEVDHNLEILKAARAKGKKARGRKERS